MKNLEKDQLFLLKSVNKENADKFLELKKLEKTANQSKVWQTFATIALDRLRNPNLTKPQLNEEKKESSNQTLDYFKAEMEFICACPMMPLPQAKEQLLDLLCLFVKSDMTFNHVPYW